MQPLDPNEGRPPDGPRRPQRSFRYGARFEAAAWEAVEKYDRLYDIIRDLEWVLERYPGAPPSEQISDEFWLFDSVFLRTSAGHVYPRVKLLYRFDEKTVEFWSMEVTDGQSPPKPEAH